MPRSVAVVLTLAVTGCSHVTFDELDPFGSLRSAYGFEFHQGGQTSTAFVASDVADLCDRTRDAVAALADATTAYTSDLAAADGRDAVCDATTAFLDDALAATRSISSPNASFLTLLLDDRDGEANDTPDDGTYRVDASGSQPALSATYVVYDDNPYRKAQDEADCEDPDEVAARIAEASDAFGITAGTAEVASKGEDKLRVELTGDLQDEAGRSAGTVELVGAFAPCRIDLDPELPLTSLPF